MGFVNVKTGKQVKLEKGYLSNPVDYQTFVKQQEAKRAAASTGKQKQDTTVAPVNRVEGPPATAKRKQNTTAASRCRAEGVPSARPSTVSLQNQLRQAQVDLDTDAILQLNRKLKEERERRGKQTLGDRVSDTMSAAFGGSGGSFANLAGFAGNLVQNPEHNRRQLSRLQESLKTGRTTDGRPITDAQRKTIQDSISRLEAEAAGWEAPESFANRAYAAADRMADTGAAYQERAKKGLGKVGSTVVDAAVSMGQSTLDAALGAATGTGMLPFVARSLGGGTQEARRSGADLDEQLLYGSAQAAKEYVTEKLFGLAVPQRMLGRAGAGSLDDAIETGIRKATERLSKTPGGQKAVGGLLTWLAGGATEGLEEGIGSLIENTLINPNLRDWDPDTRTRQQKFEDGLYDMLVGGVSGLMGLTNLGAYNVSPADAHVRGTLEMMNRAAGLGTARETAQEAPGARPEAGAGTGTPAAQGGAVEAQVTPENVFLKTAAAAKEESDRQVRDTLELMQRAAELETGTGQQETAPGTGTAVNENGLMALSQLERENLSSGKRNKVISTFSEAVNFVRNALRNKQSTERAYLGKIPDSVAQMVKEQTGVDISGFNAILPSDAVRHMFKNHGNPSIEGARGQVALTHKTAANLSAVLASPDRVSMSGVKDAFGRPTLLFEKKIGDQYITAQAITDGTKSLTTDTMYIKKVSPATADATQTSPSQTPETSSRQTPSADTIQYPDSLVNPSGMDGLGAADAGSLNSDYDRLQAQSSRFHPEGENAARPVDVPMQDFDGYNIPKSASTMMGAASLHNENVQQLEQMVADGLLSFGTIHDGDALLYADKILKEKGFDAALERYRNDVQSNVATKGNTALGQLLMRDAAALGNTDALAEIFQLYAANSTTIAQAMQAQSMLRKLPPESQLVTVQKALDTLNEKYQLDLKMDPADVQDFMGAESQEAREAVRQRIVEKAAKEVPSTFRAKFDAVRYLAMLGNPKTHFRNIIGNLAFQIPATAKNRVGALAERGAQALGADVERTKSLTGVNPFGALAKEARADWSNAKPFLEGSKYSEGKVTARSIEQEAKPFQNSGALGKAVGWAADKNGALLEAEDNLFKRWIYSQSLAGYLQANGVKSISEADPALLNRARNYAAQEALRNTFNDKNLFSDAVASPGKLINSKNPFLKGFGYAVEGVLPFKRTPANVLARAVEYSPVGPVLDVYNVFRDAKAGKMNQETVLKHLDRQAAALSGSALLRLGWLLSGMITGGEDPDEDQRKFDDLTGHQSYALELDNGTSVTLDWLAPSAIPFFMGVELAHAQQDGGLTPEEALNALKSIGEPMLEMSMLQGLNDVFEDAAYAQQHGGSVPAALMVNAATNYLTQAVPTLFGQMERSAEDRRMTTYGDKNNPLFKDVQFFLGKLSQKVPGWDYNQIPYLDAWGREEESGDPVERVFNNFFNPAYVSQVYVDQVENELQRVKDATGDGGVFPTRAARYFTVNKEQKNLTAEEYQTYAKKRGQTSLEVLRSMLSSPGYQKLSDEKKAEAISDAYQYADAIGKMAVSDYRPGDGTVAAGALKTMLPPAGYILYRINKDRDGDGKVTNLESTQALQELPDLSGKQRGEAWAALNSTAKAAKNPFTGVLAEEGMTPEEAAAAWGIYGRSGTKEEPYTKRQKKQDLREELDLTTQEVNRVWDLMVRAMKEK